MHINEGSKLRMKIIEAKINWLNNEKKNFFFLCFLLFVFARIYLWLLKYVHYLWRVFVSSFMARRTSWYEIMYNLAFAFCIALPVNTSNVAMFANNIRIIYDKNKLLNVNNVSVIDLCCFVVTLWTMWTHINVHLFFLLALFPFFRSISINYSPSTNGKVQ